MKKLRLWMMLITVSVFAQGAISMELLAQGKLPSSMLVSRTEISDLQNKEIVSLADLLATLEHHFDVTFLFKDEVVANKFVVANKIKIGEKTGEELSQILDELGLSFRRVDEQTYVLLRKYPVLQKVYLDEQITGTVTDAETGETLPGVNIIVKGTTIGTSTDSGGKYKLNVSSLSDTLMFSFVGYQTQEIPINGRAEIDVALQPQIVAGGELVVVGYGSMEREDLTGSISSVKSSDIQELSSTRVDDAILGKVSGVQVKAVSGAPGAAPQIRIRGIGSISAGSNPLFVVDGVPTDNIQTLSPNDIESIDILKDASATAIYGSRGSNGVVIINTKRGVMGETEFIFDTYFGLQKVSRIPQSMNAMELAQYALDGMRNKNMDEGYDVSGPPDTWNYPLPQTHIDVLAGQNATDNQMIDEILRIAPQRQYQLTASGGSENVRYALSGEFLGDEGIIKNSNFKRFSLRANIDANLSERLTVKLNLNPSFTDENITDESSEGSYGSYISASPVNRAKLWPPFFPAYDENGEYFMFDHAESAQEWSPIAMVNEIINKQKRARFFGNINAEFQIFDELEASILLGTSVASTKGSRFVPELEAFAGGGSHNIATGRDNASMNVEWLTEYMLNYNNSFGNHNISGLVGFTAQKDRFESNFLYSNRYPNNLIPTLNAVSGIITDGTSNITEWSMVSYLSRLNYNFNNKYYVTASIRSDGSSRFGNEKKYGLFKSLALAWRISGENFLNDVAFLSNLKLRASYGQTGNNNIGNYEHLATITNSRYTLGGRAVQGFAPGRLANPLLTWETQNQINTGFDLGLFDDRINLTVDRFQSISSNLLLNVNIPAISGFTNTLQNIGEVKNTGWEISAGFINLQGKFGWTTDFNISTYKNKVVKLGPKGDPIFTRGGMVSGAHITMIGEPIGMFYGLLTDGIFMNQAEVDEGPIYGAGTAAESRPGDIRYVDINGDGEINGDDRTIMGLPYPDFYYGMTNRFSYQNFSLSISLNGSQGNEVLNMAGIGQLNMRGARVLQSAKNLNYWKSEDDPGDGHTPRPNDAPKGGNREMSQRYLDTGSFLRINNISLNYLVPDNISQRLNLNSLRVYVNATNPFTFTKNELSFNPDVSNSGDPLTPGVDFSDYPLPKSLIIGLNVGF